MGQPRTRHKDEKYFVGDIYDLCQWKREVKKFSFNNIAFKEEPKIQSYRRCGKKEKKYSFFFLFYFQRLHRRSNLFFLVANWHHADKNQLVRRSTLDLNVDSAHGQPAPCVRQGQRI